MWLAGRWKARMTWAGVGFPLGLTREKEEINKIASLSDEKVIY